MHSSTFSTMSTPLSTIGSTTSPRSVAPLVRPWSAPLPTVGRASRVRRAWGTGALVVEAFLMGASASWAAVGEASPGPVAPVTASVVRPDVPPCGYSVEGRTLFVKSFTARGRVRVYRNAPFFDKVRDRHPIGRGESMVLRLRRSGHSELDLVAYVGKKECEPA